MGLGFRKFGLGSGGIRGLRAITLNPKTLNPLNPAGFISAAAAPICNTTLNPTI